MVKKVCYYMRLFSVLSIIFLIIAFILLFANLFFDVTFEFAFAGIVGLILFIDHLIFIPGNLNLNKREYKNYFLANLNFFISLLMIVAICSMAFIKLSDLAITLIFSCLLISFLIVFNLQSIYYSFNVNIKKKIHFARRLIIVIFFSSCSLVVSLYYLVHLFRG